MDHIITFMEKQTGFYFDDHRKKDVDSIIKKHLTKRDMQSTGDYLAFIQSTSGRQELTTLINDLTIGETYFFRNPNHWKAFIEVAIPEIIKSKQAL